MRDEEVETHAGILSISQEALLRMLLLDEGRVLSARFNLENRCFEMLVEHPEAPIVREAEQAQHIAPTVTVETCEHGFTKVTRVGLGSGYVKRESLVAVT